MQLIGNSLFFPIIASAFNPAITDITPTPCWGEFQTFQHTYNKQYDSLEEQIHRFQIFEDNCLHILNHDSIADSTFNVNFNQFSDLTATEFDTLYKGYSSSLYNCENIIPRGCDAFELAVINEVSAGASSIDWRMHNAVTPVKNQGSCGSCWSFSTTGSIEGAYAIKSGNLISLSEQQLVDCSTTYGNAGCNGGMMDFAFDYVETTNLCTEEAYPYTAEDDTCSIDTCESDGIQISGCIDVTTNNQTALKEAVNIGPVSIAIEADTATFQFYSDGIITSDRCGTNLDHGVLIVGYGTEDDQDYWLVKNSWGDTWGDEGYVKIARTDNVSDEGICGIAMSASFPVM